VASLLEVSGVRAGYVARRPVIHGLSLSLNEGETFLLLGHNGAGKTTFLKTIYGVLSPWSGTVIVAGDKRVESTPSAVALGLSFSPAGGGNVFRGLTVRENLRVAAEASHLSNDELLGQIDFVFTVFPALAKITKMIAGQLSGGQQRMLSVGMALMQRPRILLLDEPSLGLAPLADEQLYAQISLATTENRIAVLLVEQNINTSFVRCDRFGVLRMGEFVFQGDGSALKDKETERELLSHM
jgi:branched-chain amino acid transport system ATP-binding protein